MAVTMSKNKVLVALLIGLVFIGEQVCYANAGKGIVVYDSSREVMVKEGVYLVSSENKGLQIIMGNIQGTEDLQKVTFIIRNDSGDDFKLGRIKAINLFEEDPTPENRCSDVLVSGQQCEYIFTGTIDKNSFGSKSYLQVGYDDNGDYTQKIVRPWAPLFLKQNKIDLSKDQKINIKNVFPDEVKVLKITLQDASNAGGPITHGENGCDKIAPNGMCVISVSGQSVPTKGYILNIKYKINNTVPPDYVATIANVVGGGYQELDEGKSEEVLEKTEDQSQQVVSEETKRGIAVDVVDNDEDESYQVKRHGKNKHEQVQEQHGGMYYTAIGIGSTLVVSAVTGGIIYYKYFRPVGQIVKKVTGIVAPADAPNSGKNIPKVENALIQELQNKMGEGYKPSPSKTRSGSRYGAGNK